MKRHFNINRKIIANMTTESWREVPHCGLIYEADVELLLEELKNYNSDKEKEKRISINSAMLKVICEGVKKAPKMNSHIKYNRWLLSGSIEEKTNIDVSLPIQFDDGKMMTVTLKHLQDKSMGQIQHMIRRLREKIKNTDLEATFYKMGLKDTFEGVFKGKIIKAAGRLIGAKVGKSKVAISRKRMKASKESVANGISISPEDIRQGTITVSNVGSLYKEWNGEFTLLNIVPPQVCAISVGAMQKKPVIKNDKIEITKIIPLTIAFDHRAIDFGDVVLFMKKLDKLLLDKEAIRALI